LIARADERFNKGSERIVDLTSEEVESKTLELGGQLLHQVRQHTPTIFDKKFWHAKVLDRAMSDSQFRTDLLRLVDVFPVLKDDPSVLQHVREYLVQGHESERAFVKSLVTIASGGLASAIAVRAFKKNMEDMAKQFIAGQNAKSASSQLRKLRQQGFHFTLDLLGEATLSDTEADVYAERYLDLIEKLPKALHETAWSQSSRNDDESPIPVTNVSIKVSALEPHLDPVDIDGSVSRLRKRVVPILDKALSCGAFINFDLEQWTLHEITYRLFEGLLMEDRFREWPHVGIVVQAYLRDSANDIERLDTLARKRKTPFTVRLVKGAYWDYEAVRANQNGYQCPVFMQKAETDRQFELLTRMLFERAPRLRAAIASHNIRSTAHAIAVAELLGIRRDEYEFQSLYGMAEPERKALLQRGHFVRVYVPLGELLPGMSYLVRRLLENTANTSFLKLTHHDSTTAAVLLAPPMVNSSERGAQHDSLESLSFSNCSLTDFTRAEERKVFDTHVREIKAQLPIKVPVIIDGRRIDAHESFDRLCPNSPDKIVARVQCTPHLAVERAMSVAAKACASWRATSIEYRANLLRSLGALMRERRYELAALECHEVGKPWAESDADVAEAIDFCYYYAQQAETELAPRKLSAEVLGEQNLLTYEGRGPSVVIAPWNFPLAILCGMTTAVLVSGNPVLIKPAEQSSATAFRFFQLLQRAGFPVDVVTFLPGRGELVGRALVAHSSTAQIAFTGSRKVGEEILCAAATIRPGQRHVKRVLLELGGKNAIIVDEDADVDQAIRGTVYSAFGYAGQKCSACSRVIVVGQVYPEFIKRLIEATKSLRISMSHDPGCQIPPVVDAEACARLKKVLENPGKGATCLFRASDPGIGYAIPPTIFEVSDPKHPLMQEEFFGPILSVLHVDNIDAAFEAANETDFALTGGIYSRLPSNLARAQEQLVVGNLYLNRPCTGAVVGRQPFGGYRLSGGGTKAGGPGYLLNFCNPRVVCENTMRQGFSPDIEN